MYNEKTNTIEILVPSDSWIGGGWYGFSLQSISTEVGKYPDANITLLINNLGGDVSEALAIRAYLEQEAAKGKSIKAKFVGFSASAATVMVMAIGVERTMDEYSYVLIHNAHGLGYGEAKDLQDAANDLQKFTDTIANIYAAIGTKTATKMAEVMDAAQWLSAKECLALGIIDSIVKGTSETQMTAQNNKVIIKNKNLPPMNTTPENQEGMMEKAFRRVMASMGISANNIAPTPQNQIVATDELPTDTPEMETETPEAATSIANNAVTTPTNTPMSIIQPTMDQPKNIGLTVTNNFAFKRAKVGNATKVVPIAKPRQKLNQVEAYFVKHMLGQDLPKNCGCGDVPNNLDHLNWTAISAELGDQVVEIANEIVINRFARTFGNGIPTSWGYIRDREYTNIQASFGEFLQPWGCDFNPKGLTTFDLVKNIPRAVKGDLALCDGALAQSYFNYLLNESHSPFEHPLAMWLAERMVEQAAIDNVSVFWFGEYSTTDIDTPGVSALDSYNGIHTLVDTAITDGAVLPITTGAYNALSNNATTMLAAFRAGFPQGWAGQSITIYCSPTFAENYAKENDIKYDSAITEFSDYRELDPIRIQYTNHYLVPQLSFGAGSRLIAVKPGNIMFMGGRPQDWGTIRSEICGRKHCFMFDAVAGAGINSFNPLWLNVNEQVNTLNY